MKICNNFIFLKKCQNWAKIVFFFFFFFFFFFYLDKKNWFLENEHFSTSVS